MDLSKVIYALNGRPACDAQVHKTVAKKAWGNPRQFPLCSLISLRHMHRMHSRPLREDAFRGSVRQLVRLGDGLAGDLAVVDIEPVAQVRVL